MTAEPAIDTEEQKYDQEIYDVLTNLYSFLNKDLNRNWIESHLEFVIKDQQFIELINFFVSQQRLNGMSLFEFMFFECGYYQIANWVKEYKYYDEQKIFDMLFGTFFLKVDGDWIEGVDLSNKVYSTYGSPTKCEFDVIYQYDDSVKIEKRFNGKQGIEILANTNLLLQYVDQRKLNKLKKQYEASDAWKGLIIWIDLNIQYDDSTIYRLNDYKFEVGTELNWKISDDLSCTMDSLHVSSLWITNNCCIMGRTENTEFAGSFTIICQENILIDENCSISMDELGVKGAIYDDKMNKYIQQMIGLNTNCNGESNQQFGGGGGYREDGENGVNGLDDVDGYGGNKYLTDDIIKSDDRYKRFFVGFGGGCGQNKGSKGGNGGGRIFILCNKLIIKEGGKITSNGGDGINYGGGGSGGSIVIITNDTNIDKNNIKHKLSVNGGKGDKINNPNKDGGNGSDGLVQFGYIDDSTNCIKFVYNDDFIDDTLVKLNYSSNKLFSSIIEYNIDNKYMFSYFCEWVNNGNEIFQIKILSKADTDSDWIESYDPKQTLFTEYPPSVCELHIMYEYDENNRIEKTFKTMQSKQMLINANLILQHVDQRILHKLSKKYSSSCNKWEGLIIHINMEAKHHDLWKWSLNDYQIAIGTEFNWKMSHNSTLTVSVLYTFSLWIDQCFISSFCAIDGHDDDEKDDIKHGVPSNTGHFRIVCQNNLLIDKDSSIKMNECGIKGAIFDVENGKVIYEIQSKHNGQSGWLHGGGAGYKEDGADDIWRDGVPDGRGGKNYLTDLDNMDIKDKQLSVGFGGGCAKYKLLKQSKGGSGGGKIEILCDNLMIKEGGRIQANGGDGVCRGGGGSGGSILIVTNNKNMDEMKFNMEKHLSVKGGKGDDGAGDGSDGIFQFGYIDQSTNNIICNDMILSNTFKPNF